MELTLSIALACVFLQVALTFWSIITMGQARLKEIARKQTSVGEVALSPRNFSSEQARAMQNNAHNQFETPILLYAGVALAAALDASNAGVALGAVIYVASRLLHRAIHVGTNRVSQRFRAFVLGLAGLAVLWLALGVGIVIG
ncbi:MAPEG family protein [Pontivivens insulae]|uniref:MAPEG family protein n=1 Tax=Pontivivens insulae TaxID=1639689 RepID=A0A2R8ABL6_9RHOB|nr:MAPEG family protein [Pontivivens insulae]RED11211.1 hypothetical protein DFR53_3244 [Pontivivens insulae]SPF29616.1 hypothetical protein POI8812_01929 [Pontivivens insulae]